MQWPGRYNGWLLLRRCFQRCLPIESEVKTTRNAPLINQRHNIWFQWVAYCLTDLLICPELHSENRPRLQVGRRSVIGPLVYVVR